MLSKYLIVLFFVFTYGIITPFADEIAIADNNQTEYWAICSGHDSSNDEVFDEYAEMTKYVLCSLGWQDDHILLLTGAVSQEDFLEALSWLNEHEDQDDVVLLWCFSHGSKIGNAFIQYDDLNEELDKLDSERIGIFISACYSGCAIPEISKSGRIIVTSSRSDEVSGGIFDKCLCALQGHGDFLGDNDGNISFEEMFNFLIKHEEGLNNFTPQMDDNVPGDLDICFINNSARDPDQFQNLFFCTSFPVNNRIIRAQSFIPSFNKLKKVKLFIGRTGDPGQLTVSIKQNLTGTEITTIKISEESILPFDQAFISYDIDFPETEVIPGETYYIVCTTEEVQQSEYDAFLLALSGDVGSVEYDAYENGSSYFFTADHGWVKMDEDLCFIVYTEAANLSVTTLPQADPTPGFELILAVCAMALVLLWKRKRHFLY